MNSNFTTYIVPSTASCAPIVNGPVAVVPSVPNTIQLVDNQPKSNFVSVEPNPIPEPPSSITLSSSSIYVQFVSNGYKYLISIEIKEPQDLSNVIATLSDVFLNPTDIVVSASNPLDQQTSQSTQTSFSSNNLTNQSGLIQNQAYLETNINSNINSNIKSNINFLPSSTPQMPSSSFNVQSQPYSSSSLSQPSTSVPSTQIPCQKKRTYRHRKAPIVRSSKVPGQNTRKFICREGHCDKTFSSKMTLNNHKRIFHRGTKSKLTFRCIECDLIFDRSSLLANHRKQVHEEEAIFECDYPDCTKTTNDKGNMTKHKMIHKDEPTIMCKYTNCGLLFLTYSKLRDHRYAEHPTINSDLYQCEVVGCGRNFHTPGFLRRHYEKIHKIDKEVNNKCIIESVV